MSADDTPTGRPTATTRHVSEPGARSLDRPSHEHTTTADSTPTNHAEGAGCDDRIVALERSLAESERRRQAIIDQYELILKQREDVPPPRPEGDAGDGLLARVRSIRSLLR